MKKISYYTVISFLPPFLFSLALFFFFLFWGIFLEKTFMISKGKASFYDVFKIAFFQTPSLSSLIIPVASMTGAFFSFRKMISLGEWKAFQAAGWSPFEIIKPLLFFSVFIALGHFLFSEFVAVRAFHKYKDIYNIEIKKRAKSEYQEVKNPVFKYDDSFFKADYYSPLDKKFSGFYCLKLNDGRPLYSAFAASAVYDVDSSLWTLENGGEFHYRHGGGKYLRFKSKKIALLPRPEKLFFPSFTSADSENFLSLLEKIKNLRDMGLKRNVELIVFWGKITKPLSSFAMILVAAAVAMSGLGAYGIAGAGFSIVFGFGYWSISMMLEKMAEIELLSPFAAAFITPVFFSASAFIALKRFRAF